jgi:anti-sigma factor RsiW
MTDHLSPASLNSFVDTELSAEQLASATEHPAGCPSCAAALLLLSVSIAVVQRNLRQTTIPSGESDVLVTEACDQASAAGPHGADCELAERLRRSIQLARWGLLSTVSEVKA